MQNWNLKTQIAYSLGKDDQENNLPFISPLRYNAGIEFKKEKITAGIFASGNLAQNNFAKVYGQTKTPDYLIFNINAGYSFDCNQNKIKAQAGIENIFDKYYATFSDWNKIPRMGRNGFINFTYSFH